MVGLASNSLGGNPPSASCGRCRWYFRSIHITIATRSSCRVGLLRWLRTLFCSCAADEVPASEHNRRAVRRLIRQRPCGPRSRGTDTRTPDLPDERRRAHSRGVPAPTLDRQRVAASTCNTVAELSATPGTSPSPALRLRSARRRAGRSVWGTAELEVRRRQICRRFPRHLVLLLQQPGAATKLAHLGPFLASLTGLAAFLDISLLEPIRQGRFRDPEILRDLRQRHPALTGTSNRYNILAELLGIRAGRNNIVSSRAKTLKVSCHQFLHQTHSNWHTSGMSDRCENCRQRLHGKGNDTGIRILCNRCYAESIGLAIGGITGATTGESVGIAAWLRSTLGGRKRR